MHAVFKPRTGCKRSRCRVDSTEAIDVFVRPSEPVMATARLAVRVTLMGYVHNREEGPGDVRTVSWSRGRKDL